MEERNLSQDRVTFRQNATQIALDLVRARTAGLITIGRVERGRGKEICRKQLARTENAVYAKQLKEKAKSALYFLYNNL